MLKTMSNELNSFLFSTPEMTRIFSAQEQLRMMMRFEWALIRALEKQGIAEAGCGVVMESLLDASFVDVESLTGEARDAGNIVIPFVRQLTAAVKAQKQEAAYAIHLGATSQDVLDTALVLQMRDALALIDRLIEQLDRKLVGHIRAHAGTVLSGRTWLRAGPPTTFGLKLAGTLAALRRGRTRILTATHRALVLQFGGAVGTLAALGAAGEAVSAEVATILQLQEPELPWSSQRDRVVEIVQVLGILTGTLAKFARDMALLEQDEVGEVSESASGARGTSSTMPHKHNSVACAAVLAAHARMPGLAATMLGAMPQEHERGLGWWQAEWETVPEAFRLAAAALSSAIAVVEGLTVNAKAMQANIDGRFGVTLSEAVNAALAPALGRSEAHEILRKATSKAVQEKRSLGDVLKELPEVTAHLSVAKIDALLDPRAYLGSAERFIARVLGEADADS